MQTLYIVHVCTLKREHCTFDLGSCISLFNAHSPSSNAATERPQMPLPYPQPGGVWGPISGPSDPPMGSPSHISGNMSTSLPGSGHFQGAPSPSRHPKMTGRSSPMMRASYTHDYAASNQQQQLTDSQRKRAESVDTFAYARV